MKLSSTSSAFVEQISIFHYFLNISDVDKLFQIFTFPMCDNSIKFRNSFTWKLKRSGKESEDIRKLDDAVAKLFDKVARARALVSYLLIPSSPS